MSCPSVLPLQPGVSLGWVQRPQALPTVAQNSGQQLLGTPYTGGQGCPRQGCVCTSPHHFRVPQEAEGEGPKG